MPGPSNSITLSQNDEIQVFDLVPTPSVSRANTPNNVSEKILKKPKKAVNCDSILEKATGALDNLASLYQHKEEVTKSSNQVFGEFVASKLSEIRDSKIKNDVEFEIAKLLYEAIKQRKERH